MRVPSWPLATCVLCAALLSACDGDKSGDTGNIGGSDDTGTGDPGGDDPGTDSGDDDGGGGETGTSDTGTSDSGTGDTGTGDTGTSDTGTSDSGTSDTGTSDSGSSDTGSGPVDADGDGYTDDEDCDDTDAAVNPGATEACSGRDDDCDGLVDDADDSLDTSTGGTWYTDADEDGYGDADSAISACEQPDGTVEDATDCDDGAASVNPGATEVCSELDDDCDGLVDDDDDSVDATTGTAWYTDDDGDGYGLAGTGAYACEQPSGTVRNYQDCDDTDADVNPAADEACNWVDDDCDGTVDNGLDDTDGSGVADCKEVAVVATAGFQASASGTCDGEDPVDRELGEIADHLADMGLTAVLFLEDSGTGVSESELSPYPVVVYDNGGWSAPGSTTTLASLQAVAAAGAGLVFVGDDNAKHAYRFDTESGTESAYDLMYIDTYTSNGEASDLAVEEASHAVMDGEWGVVGDFSYLADVDVCSTTETDETVLMVLDGSSSPAVWAADDGTHRTVVMGVGIYNSGDCPIADTSSLGEIQVLFQNAVWWAGQW